MAAPASNPQNFFFCTNLIFYQFAEVFSCKSFNDDSETFMLQSPRNHSLLWLVPGTQACIVYLGS